MQIKTHFLKSTPFAKLIIPLVLGILLGFAFDINIFVSKYIVIGLFLTFFFAHFKIKKPKYLIYLSILGYLLILFLGIFLTENQEIRNQPLHYSNLLEKTDSQTFLYGKIEMTPEKKEKSIKLLVEIIQLQEKSRKQLCHGRILLYLQKDSIANALKKGDEILFLSKLVKIPPPQNPGEFDFAQFMANKNIFNQQYLPTKSYAIQVSKNKDYLEIFKNYYLKLLENNVKSPRALALAKGLIIGARSDIDQQTYSAFSHTGIIHILSVSGLHLGIVMTILLWLFGLIPFTSKKWLWIKTFIILLFIWAFAIITGFSTAVQRAALMASIYIIGKSINNKTSNFNILFASLFLICLFNPLVLKDLGLQLSYLALIGLAVFHSLFYNLVYLKNKVLNKIWEWTATSFAAQTTTLPLILYYFGSFPTYFILANPPAILLSFVILALGLALMVFGFVPFIGKTLGFLINYACLLLIYIVECINNLPYAIWDNIHSGRINLFLNFGAVFFLILWVYNKKIKWIGLASFCILLSFGYASKEILNLNNVPKTIIYSVPKHTILGSVNGRKHYIYADTLLDEKSGLYNFKVKNSIRFFGAKDIYFKLIKEPIIVVNGKKILIWNNEMNSKSFDQKQVFDYILLTKNNYLDFKILKENYAFKYIVLDGTLSIFKIEKLKLKLEEAQLPFYVLSEKGALVF
jgi:competence protein ComEC